MKHNWWKGLQVKIIAWSFVPTVIILSAVAWFTFYSYQKVISDQAVKENQQTIQSKMVQISQAHNNLVAPVIISLFMEVDTNRTLSLEERAGNILERTKGLEIFDGGIYFLDLQGKVFKAQPEAPEVLGQDWSGTPADRFIHEHTNMSALTDIMTFEPSGRKVICSAVAILDIQAEYAGAGYYCLAIYPVAENIYTQTMNSLNLGQDVYLLDRNLQVIHSAVPSEIGGEFPRRKDIQHLLQGEIKSVRFHDAGGDQVVGYAPLSAETDAVAWSVVNLIPWSEIMQPSLPFRLLLLGLLGLGVILPVIVTAYGVRHITEPVQKLIRAAQQVTEGRFDQRIEVKTGDEIETLANEFNRMSEELKDSYSLLEKKVADRTRELAVMNSIISETSKSMDIHGILEEALALTVEQVGFEAGAAFKLEQNPFARLLIASHGVEPAAAVFLLEGFTAAGGNDLAGYPVEPVHLAEGAFPGEQGRDWLLQRGFGELVYIPLSTKGQNLGCFILCKQGSGTLSPEEVSLLQSIGRQVGVAMENASLYEQAEQAAVAAERNRLARELHDAVTQTLFSASLIADVIPRIWERNPQEGMHNLEELRQLTRGALAEMRTMLLEMRPESLERAEIKSLLTQLADAFVGRVRVPVLVEVKGECEKSNEVKIVFYRVAQEALNNIAKHAGARQVELHLECQPGRMGMLIRDDGLGFDPGKVTPGHLGISIMRERAASIGADLLIDSNAGIGTTIQLNWKSNQKE